MDDGLRVEMQAELETGQEAKMSTWKEPLLEIRMENWMKYERWNKSSDGSYSKGEKERKGREETCIEAGMEPGLRFGMEPEIYSRM